MILEGVAQTWALEKSLAAACPQYELLLHEALTLQLAQWPKVKRVLQNATARWQDQSSASSVPLSLCPSLSLGDTTVKTTETPGCLSPGQALCLALGMGRRHLKGVSLISSFFITILFYHL